MEPVCSSMQEGHKQDVVHVENGKPLKPVNVTQKLVLVIGDSQKTNLPTLVDHTIPVGTQMIDVMVNRYEV